MAEKVKLVLDEKNDPYKASDGIYLVRVPLTEDEYASLARELGERVIRKLRIAEEKKEVVSDYNEKIASEEKEIERLSFYIKSGEKEETMALEVQKNSKEDKLEFVNADGEIVATLPMRPQDKQEELTLKKNRLMNPPEEPEEEAVLNVTASGWAKPKKEEE